LQAAVCAYYDFDQPSLTNIRLPVMSFVRDITIGEGEAVPPSTKFIKTWRIKNIGKKKLLNHKSWQKTLDLVDNRLRFELS
jgi:hypothetical protein